MADYFTRFYGPAAAAMAAYWEAIDASQRTVNVHAGSIYSVHDFLPPALVDRLRGLLAEAATAAGADERLARRVALARDGLQNAEDFLAIRAAINGGQPAAAKAVYDRFLEREEALVKERLVNHYTPGYLKRFIGKSLDAALQATAAPNRIVGNLPDRWRFRYDAADEGRGAGWFQPAFEDAAWPEVVTYSATLDAQGIPEQRTVMWYRASFELPAGGEPHFLFFYEVDGVTEVFVNGQSLGAAEKGRRPFALALGEAGRPGTNRIALRVDHSVITELTLGGLIRPVLLVQGTPPAAPAAK